ncbi:MAG: D-alanyl-D-alanine carboxypeptidase [Clostridiales bacterium]|nr:D-alanyl-D-alanine carboxypeptidase [Clostridiales bacterium]
MKKALILILCVILTLVSIPIPMANASYNSLLEDLDTHAEILLLASLDDGSVIFEKNADMKSSPASLTKIVTAMLVLEKCSNLNDVVKIPEYTIRMFDGLNSSNAGLMPGEQISVMNLLYCLLVKSANEAAAILADYVSGSIEEFVALMNEYVVNLGCKNTHFVNPHGLDEDGQYITANDLAIIIKHSLSKDFEQRDIFVKITSTEKYTVPATNISAQRVFRSTNSLMNSGIPDYYCKYAKGIKTGTTSKAGRCVISTASKDGYSYLGIVLKAPFYDIDGDKVDENCAFIDCKLMFNWAFDNIKLKQVAAQTQIVTVAKVDLAKGTDYVRLVPEKELYALVPSGVNAGSVLIEAVEGELPESLQAPVKKGQVVGRAVVLYADEEIARVNLVAAEGVSRSTFLYMLSMVKKATDTVVFKMTLMIFILIVIFFVAMTIYINYKKRQKRKLRVLNYRDVSSRAGRK